MVWEKLTRVGRIEQRQNYGSIGKWSISITDPRKIGEFLRAIDVCQGVFWVACALKMMPLVIVRPGELRLAEWAEFDFQKNEWRIPAHRMKMKEQHIVPLSIQVTPCSMNWNHHLSSGKKSYVITPANK